ncbi:MAG: CAP domain-containing protein [Leptolyngbyaceae bacterium]|nr:CAP domain-containing protein [Leptolyngbyaceae bacterium]
MLNAQFESEVLRLTNEFRQQNGLGPLTIDRNLEEAADQHTQNMAQQDFFSHTGKDGSTPSSRTNSAGYETGFVGENIAAGYSTPQQVVDGWINSPGHRANMLNANYNEIGIGYYYMQNDTGSVNYYHYWTQVFGKGTIEATPTPPAPTAPSTTDPQPSTPAPNPQPVENVTVPSSTSAPEATPEASLESGTSSPNTNGPSFNPPSVSMRGSSKADRMMGDRMNNIVNGLKGNDRLFGRAGNDEISGGRGRDRISGGTGDDLLKGGRGRDVIRGGRGLNRVTGNDGRDIFVLLPGAGHTKVTDFRIGTDRIRLGGNLSLGNINIRQQGENTLIETGDDVVGVLKGVTASELTPEAFM